MRYIMFSRHYPAKHPRAGQETHFAEKILHSRWEIIPREYHDKSPFAGIYETETWAEDVWEYPKGHTIRAGNRWKKGDVFSPRVWTGKPYISPQFEFMLPVTIADVFEIRIRYTDRRESVAIWLDNNLIQLIPVNKFENIPVKIPQNDGLTPADWLAWFPADFSGQLICWDNEMATSYRKLIRT